MLSSDPTFNLGIWLVQALHSHRYPITHAIAESSSPAHVGGLAERGKVFEQIAICRLFPPSPGRFPPFHYHGRRRKCEIFFVRHITIIITLKETAVNQLNPPTHLLLSKLQCNGVTKIALHIRIDYSSCLIKYINYFKIVIKCSHMNTWMLTFIL